MKQYLVQTKYQDSGRWMLAHRVKCHYRLGYVTKAWHWPMDCREFAKLVIVEQERAEMLGHGQALQLATYLGRRRRVAGTSVFASIETRLVQREFHPRAGVSETIVWESVVRDQKDKISEHDSS